MGRTLFLSGDEISRWRGVRVLQGDNGYFRDITASWSWSVTGHQHYEVARVAGGSYWVAASTHPPRTWHGATPIVGSVPQGPQPVNPAGNEYRPDTTYIWIPDGSIPAGITPGETSNDVLCHPPGGAPGAGSVLSVSSSDQAMIMRPSADQMLSSVLSLEAPPQSSFQDSDGLISFVNLSSAFVRENKQFQVGQTVCDKISNFFATLRIKIFTKMKSGAIPPLAGDPVPKTQWDLAVTHYIFYLLTEKGGLTNFKISSETYSITQYINEFSTAFVKLIFDAAVVPEAVIADVTSFLQGVGSTLRTSWDDKSRKYTSTLLGQCHEAVPMDASGKDYRYFPKVKYYNIKIDSSQKEFRSPCSDTKVITFNFAYEYYVTGLDKDLLDDSTPMHKEFMAFLARAQHINSKEADNQLDKVLDATSDSLQAPLGAEMLDDGSNAFGVNLAEYPKVAIQPTPAIEMLLNSVY